MLSLIRGEHESTTTRCWLRSGLRSWLRSSRDVPLRALVAPMVGVVALVTSTTLRSGVLGCRLGLVYSWHVATSAVVTEVPVPIARSAYSARHVGGVVIGASSTSGKITGVGLAGRFHGLRWSGKRVLRCKGCIGLGWSLSLLATVMVSLSGLGRFRVGYGGWFGYSLEGFGGGFGFEISV